MLELGSQVLDKGLVSRDGRRIGKVDDLVLDVHFDRAGEHPPEVCAIVTGPMALADEWPRWLRPMARWAYRAIGITNPSPIIIPWKHIVMIHAVIRLDLNRGEGGLNQVAEHINATIIEHLPGA